MGLGCSTNHLRPKIEKSTKVTLKKTLTIAFWNKDKKVIIPYLASGEDHQENILHKPFSCGQCQNAVQPIKLG